MLGLERTAGEPGYRKSKIDTDKPARIYRKITEKLAKNHRKIHFSASDIVNKNNDISFLKNESKKFREKSPFLAPDAPPRPGKISSFWFKLSLGTPYQREAPLRHPMGRPWETSTRHPLASGTAARNYRKISEKSSAKNILTELIISMKSIRYAVRKKCTRKIYSRWEKSWKIPG